VPGELLVANGGGKVFSAADGEGLFDFKASMPTAIARQIIAATIMNLDICNYLLRSVTPFARCLCIRRLPFVKYPEDKFTDITCNNF
jgi:hypothetical protein